MAGRSLMRIRGFGVRYQVVVFVVVAARICCSKRAEMVHAGLVTVAFRLVGRVQRRDHLQRVVAVDGVLHVRRPMRAYQREHHREEAERVQGAQRHDGHDGFEEGAKQERVGEAEKHHADDRRETGARDGHAHVDQRLLSPFLSRAGRREERVNDVNAEVRTEPDGHDQFDHHHRRGLHAPGMQGGHETDEYHAHRRENDEHRSKVRNDE